MPSYKFKLMGALGDAGERLILVKPEEHTLGEVKEIVRKEYKLIPSFKITFLHKGKRYSDDVDHHRFRSLAVDPKKESITVIASNPNR